MIIKGRGFRGGSDEKMRRMWLGLEIVVAGLDTCSSSDFTSKLLDQSMPWLYLNKLRIGVSFINAVNLTPSTKLLVRSAVICSTLTKDILALRGECFITLVGLKSNFKKEKFIWDVKIYSATGMLQD